MSFPFAFVTPHARAAKAANVNAANAATVRRHDLLDGLIREYEEIAVGVVIAPLLPGINDDPEQIATVVRAAEAVGAESIDALPLHLRGATKAVFMRWLSAHRPELVERYQALFGHRSEMDGAERRRLLELVRPRGRTWDDRVGEIRQSDSAGCRRDGDNRQLSLL